uniref:Lipoprotein signal peptidase n=1 Tax=Paulinella longichromatophora TaxID=1708747 RepID=A0A2H4ZNK2_9EUKA|nr:lipoprotein signal peptidase [Paulinella longichromatophora]
MVKQKVRPEYILLLAILFTILDQIGKYWSGIYLSRGIPQDWIPNLVEFQLITNTGTAFSLLESSNYLLGLISFAVILSLIAWILLIRVNRLWQGLAIALLLGGTLGNGLDRWRLGFVIDFLALIRIDFPIFNEADVAINLAIICFTLNCFSYYERRKDDRG